MEWNTYNINRLIEKINRKERVKYVFFWRHTTSKNGSISNACLSQWWHSLFTVEGIKYATAEYWMMAKKAELFHDSAMEKLILKASSPAEAKSWAGK